MENTCQYYKPTEKPKIELCMLKMKLSFLCHFSEKHIGTYTEDSHIINVEELK